MKPFCIATIGGIIGIIMGLYFQNIALFAVLFILLIFLLVIGIGRKKKKIIKVFIIFFSSFLFFCIYTNLQENRFTQINRKYNDKEVQIQAIIINDKVEKEYKDVYQIQILKVGQQEEKLGFKMILNVKRQKEKNVSLKYGDVIALTATYEQPSEARNQGGFDYSQYLKTKKIAGIFTVKATDVKIVNRNKNNMIAKVIHDIRNSIIKRVNQILPKDTANLCTGLLIGEKSELSEDIQETFRKSNLSHMLAISGAHISYILLGITTVMEKLKFHKRWGKVLLIMFFTFFTALTGFSPSVTRSCIMVILQLLANILFRKSDTYQNLAISSFVILLVNPYTLLDIGFQLSFGGTIGIVVFSKKIGNKKEIRRKTTSKFLIIIEKGIHKVKEMCIVTLAANLVIIPIMMYHFNTVSLTFFISNLSASPILGISLILGMIFILSLFILPLAKLISVFLQPILQMLIGIAEISSELPFSQILVPTPKIWQIILYYVLLIFISFSPYKHFKRSEFLHQYQKVIVSLLLFFIILPYILPIIPTNQLVISFIDVGQGDSMLIQTPSHKTILIDGGGSETGSFDVGEKTLIPYLSDKGIMKIDYMIFSHFDSDHCQGLLCVMERLKVKNAIIGKQGEKSNNYMQFLKIAKQRNIKVVVVQAGNHITIDKQCYLSILFPEQKLITTNVLNNNSLVAKFVYKPKEFSLLLTGDIEKVAEQQLSQMYQSTEVLQANILKIAHHRF